MTAPIIEPVGADLLIRLRDARERRHLTQEAVAKLAGISGQTVSACERGARSVSIGLLVRLAKIYGVTPGSLLDGLWPPPSVRSSRPRIVSDDEMDRRALKLLHRAHLNLTPSQIRKSAKMCEFCAMVRT
jgi:transcriptional regulator with XRE-family HTH domain